MKDFMIKLLTMLGLISAQTPEEPKTAEEARAMLEKIFRKGSRTMYGGRLCKVVKVDLASGKIVLQGVHDKGFRRVLRPREAA